MASSEYLFPEDPNFWNQWIQQQNPNNIPTPPNSDSSDNAALFEQRFQAVYDKLHNILDTPVSSSVPLLQDLLTRSFNLQYRNTQNVRKRQKGYIERMKQYGIDEGKATELLHKVDDIANSYLTSLKNSYANKAVSLSQLEGLQNLQNFAQNLGTAGALAELLKLTPVNPEALKQQALASGQLANLMTTPSYASQSSSGGSLLTGLLGAGLGYSLGGFGGAGIGFLLGSLL